MDPTSKSRRYEAGGCAAGACVGVSGSAGVGAVDGCAAGRARPQQAVTTWNTLAKKTVRARVTAKAPRHSPMAPCTAASGRAARPMAKAPRRLPMALRTAASFRTASATARVPRRRAGGRDAHRRVAVVVGRLV